MSKLTNHPSAIDPRYAVCASAAANESLRLQLIAWLEWNDRNGVYSDDACIAEGLPVMTIENGLDAIKYQLAGQHSFDMREG